MDDSNQEEPPVLDWVHLPAGARETNLWECLHDAYLNHASLNRFERTLLLEFDIRHIRKFHELPEASRFLRQFSGVRSLRVSHGMPWPGEFFVPNETSRERSHEMILEYQAKSIEEAVSWSDFAERVAGENGLTEVFEASLAEGSGSAVALRLFLHVNDEFYPDFIVRAEGLAISLNSGRRFSLKEFLGMGEAYWEDFAERSRAKRAAMELGENPAM